MDAELTILIERVRGRINERPNSREKSLALTKLDECELWLYKGDD